MRGALPHGEDLARLIPAGTKCQWRREITSSKKISGGGKQHVCALEYFAETALGAGVTPQVGVGLSPSVVQSMLQKAVRRRRGPAAERLAAFFFALDPAMAARRAMVICIEDALPLLDWLVRAFGSKTKGPPRSAPLQRLFAQLMGQLAACPWRDSGRTAFGAEDETQGDAEEEAEEEAGAGASSAAACACSPEASDVVEDAVADEDADENSGGATGGSGKLSTAAAIVRAIRFRAASGAPGDRAMLLRFADTWGQRFGIEGSAAAAAPDVWLRRLARAFDLPDANAGCGGSVACFDVSSDMRLAPLQRDHCVPEALDMHCCRVALEVVRAERMDGGQPLSSEQGLKSLVEQLESADWRQHGGVNLRGDASGGADAARHLLSGRAACLGHLRRAASKADAALMDRFGAAIARWREDFLRARVSQVAL